MVEIDFLVHKSSRCSKYDLQREKNFDDDVLYCVEAVCCSLGSSDGYKEMSLFSNWYTYNLKSET